MIRLYQIIPVKSPNRGGLEFKAANQCSDFLNRFRKSPDAYSAQCKYLLQVSIVSVYCRYPLWVSIVSVYCSHLKKAKCWKSIGFIVFSLKNLSKMSVLRVLDSKNVIKQIKNNVFCSTSCIFSENPCAKLQKTQKSEKTISFYGENYSNTAKTLCFLLFLALFGSQKWKSNPRAEDAEDTEEETFIW